ncbi:MAG: hypothetical protein FD126_1536 [Elusimicrobia bacterium]|nr:MAG: hypothetical protein FD126_1536 [Elusimicrobiota bacterium]
MSDEVISPLEPLRPYRSKSDSEVILGAQSGTSEAVRELGYRDSPESLECLRVLASREFPASVLKAKLLDFEKVQRTARVAMVRRGDKTHLPEILSRLSSPNLYHRVLSIAALGEIGDRRAAKYLGPFLSDTRNPPVPGCLACPSLDSSAAGALGRLFPEVREEIVKETSKSQFLAGVDWIPWWEKNSLRFSEDM